MKNRWQRQHPRGCSNLRPDNSRKNRPQTGRNALHLKNCRCSKTNPKSGRARRGAKCRALGLDEGMHALSIAMRVLPRGPLIEKGAAPHNTGGSSMSAFGDSPNCPLLAAAGEKPPFVKPSRASALGAECEAALSNSADGQLMGCRWQRRTPGPVRAE
jgi:hypothetical protein